MTMLRRFIAGALLALALALPGSAPATVNTSQNKTIAAGNNSQTQFTFSFIGVAAADITVIYTDPNGNQTTLSQGAGSSQYQITLNAPVQGALWGVGGMVTYNPLGTPIPFGSTLTILRTLPLTQAFVLRNQTSVQTLGFGAEQAVDTAVMQDQQTAEQIGRAIQANAANSSPPLPLPPAAQVAGQGVCFDGSGNNLIGCVLPSSGVISSAMAPVVSAASIPAGRTALGLASMAQEAINSGTCGGATIQDDGSGNARVQFGTVADSLSQTVTCAFHGSQRIATGALVYTLPRANTLFNGFGFWVYPLTANVTLTANASDNFVVAGVAGSSGGSTTIPAGTQFYVSTNAAASGAWYVTLTDPLNVRNFPGLNAPVNLQLSASVASNALTVSVLNAAGNTPSALSPVVAAFRDPTATAGDPIVRSITASLSVTAPSGATLATVNGQTNRIWIAWADNAGTPVLCLYNSLNSAGPSIVPWDETAPISGTGITSGSTSAQTWYCSSGTTTTPFRILGYVESKQAGAGTWATAPSKVQLFGPGVKKPGDTAQEITSTIISTDTFSTTSFVAATNNRISITPNSAANLIFVQALGQIAFASGASAPSIRVKWSRGTTNNTNLIGSVSGATFNGGANDSTAAIAAYDLPGSGPQTYSVQGLSSPASTSCTLGQPSQLLAKEIQI